MQINVGKSLFPAYAAAAVQIKDHGVGAVNHVKAAVNSQDIGKRVDESVRAFTDLDHAIDNVGKLPVEYVPNVKKYLDGYNAAKQAVTILIATGVIPGARERVGRQQILAASEYFTKSVTASQTDNTKYGAKLATGLLDSTLEDSLAGVAMLRPGLPVIAELVANLQGLRTNMEARKPLNLALVTRTNAAFEDIVKLLDTKIAEAPAASELSAQATADVIAQTDQLLAQARDSGELLVKDAPRVSA